MDTYDKLFSTCLELEGLLALLQKRRESTPEPVRRLIDEKLEILRQNLEEINTADVDEEDEITTEAYEETPAKTPAEEAEEDAQIVQSTLFEEIEDSDSKEEESAEYVDDTPVVVEDIPVVVKDIPVVVNEAEETSEEEETTEEEEEIVRFGDLGGNFTLNDRYRFRRELFGNNDAELADALNVVEAMTTLEEAEDYFYNDLCWDPENEDVKDFMKIVEKKFAKL